MKRFQLLCVLPVWLICFALASGLIGSIEGVMDAWFEFAQAWRVAGTGKEPGRA